MFRGVPGFTLSSLSIRVPAWKKNICCEICFLAFRGCHRKYTTIIQRQNPTQVAYLAHAHIEDRNMGPPLDFAGDFNVVTENASLNLWIVRSGLYLLCIYHLPICADICLYVFFTTCQLPIYADICFYVCLTTQVYRKVALTLRGSSRETRLASSLSRAAPPDFKIYSTDPVNSW